MKCVFIDLSVVSSVSYALSLDMAGETICGKKADDSGSMAWL